MNRSRLLSGSATFEPMQPIGVPPLKAAKRIGGSRSTVYRLLRAGQLRAVKRGSSTLVLLDSIDDYLASLPPAIFGAAEPQAA